MLVEMKRQVNKPPLLKTQKRNSISLFDGFEVDSKQLKMLGPHENQQQGEGPLGLSLRKSQSFADLIETTLSKKKEVSLIPARIDNQDSERARRKKEGDKWKAGNWNAKLLRIGTWERRVARDLDLVAKCYYAKKKLVWEMLDDGLKSKMEIQWSDITAIRAAFPKNNNAVLEIELKSVPLFFRETNPQPRKHTNWQASVDFTGGQAPRYRRHHIQFEEGTLLPHYEKLLECDKRLRMLSQQPFPLSRSPYFNLNMSGYHEYSFEFNRPRADYAPMLQFSQYGIQRPGYSYVPSHQAQMLQAAAQRPNITAYIDLAASPMSVIEFPPVEDPRRNYNIELLKDNALLFSKIAREDQLNVENRSVVDDFQTYLSQKKLEHYAALSLHQCLNNMGSLNVLKNSAILFLKSMRSWYRN